MALTTIPGSGINANSVVPAVLTEIQSSFNAGTGTLTLPNVSATTLSSGNVKTDNLLYANGSAYAFTSSAAGSNTQVQFNNNSSFAGSANLTFDTTTNTLTSTNFVGNGTGLSAITGANVSGTVANATYAVTSGSATVADTANAVAGANVTGQVGNATVAGTVYTAAQPNITSVGTLTSLSVTGNISGSNISATSTLASTSKTTGALTVAGGVGVAGDLYAGNSITVDGGAYGNVVTTQFAGVFATANGPNPYSIMQVRSNDGTTGMGMQAYAGLPGLVYSSGNIVFQTGATARDKDYPTGGTTRTTIDTTGLSVTGIVSATGNITSLNANLGNAATANYFIGNGSLLTGIAAGTATTAVNVTASSQPNITSTGTLTSLTTAGDIVVGGNLTVNGTTTTVNAATLAITDLNITVAKDATTAAAANGAGITVAGALATILYTSSSDTWNFNKTIVGDLTGLASSATIAGTVTTAAQPNITSTGTLTSLVVSGNITSGNANLGNLVTANYFIGDGGLLSNIAPSSSLVSGNSNVRVSTSSDISFSMNGTSNVVVFTSLGANINGYANITGNVTFGNLAVSTYANLGSVSGLTITGGSNNYVLQTNGTGTLSWAPLGALVTLDTFSGNGVQTTFTLSATPATINYTIININGVQQFKNSYTVTGSSLVFSEAPPNTSYIEVTTFAQRPTVAGYVNRKYTGDGATSTYTVTAGCGENDVLVYLNGLCQMPVDGYTISGSSLTFSFVVSTGTEIQIRELPR